MADLHSNLHSVIGINRYLSHILEVFKGFSRFRILFLNLYFNQ